MRFVLEQGQHHFISQDLYDRLANSFKDQCPALGTSPDKIWFDAGCAHVMSLLKEHVTKGSLSAVLEEHLLSSKGETVEAEAQPQEAIQDAQPDEAPQTCFSYSL